HPTAYEDANSAPGAILPVGTAVTWTYLVTNPGNVALSGVSLSDDAGTPANPGDDFTPAPVPVTYNGQQYNAGDANHNNLLDPGETWQYTSAGVRSYASAAGQYTGVATATGTDTILGQAVTGADATNHFGAVVGVQLKKAVNARNPLNPTAAE